ncbi:MAG: hypothetical protein U1F67_15360 [Rubrivivax sp.]
MAALRGEPTSQAAVADDSVARPAAAFPATGGLKPRRRTSAGPSSRSPAVPKDRHVVEAPARIFASQEAMLAAFKAGELERDVVVACASRARAPTACPNCTS